MMVAAVALMTLPGCLVMDSLRFQRARDAALAVPSSALPVEMAFTDVDGLIGLRGMVNGKAELLFALDTGAPVSVLLAGMETAPLGLDLSDAAKLGDGPASPIGSFRYDFTVGFDSLTLSRLPMIIVPIDTMPCPDRLEKLGFRGIVGADLLRHYVVEVDFDRNILRLNDPAVWKDDGTGVTLPLTFNDGHIYVPASITLSDGRGAAGSFHVDSGKNGTLTLNPGTDPALTPPADGKIRKACFINGLEDQIEGHPVTLTAGTARAEQVPVVYGHAKGLLMGDSIGTIGAGALRRWNITIDYPGKRLILKPREG